MFPENVPAAATIVPVKVGLADNTVFPVPVEVVTPVPPRATDKVPVVPATIGSPVIFVATPLAGVPNTGVTNVGEVANTNTPVPVSSVTADLRFAEFGVAKNVATLLAKPLTPVDIGNPVILVAVPLAGVPKTGATKTIPEAIVP